VVDGVLFFFVHKIVDEVEIGTISEIFLKFFWKQKHDVGHASPSGSRRQKMLSSTSHMWRSVGNTTHVQMTSRWLNTTLISPKTLAIYGFESVRCADCMMNTANSFVIERHEIHAVSGCDACAVRKKTGSLVGNHNAQKHC
jgi:hypothetical protein